jgi:hypothetical protein
VVTLSLGECRENFADNVMPLRELDAERLLKSRVLDYYLNSASFGVMKDQDGFVKARAVGLIDPRELIRVSHLEAEVT